MAPQGPSSSSSSSSEGKSSGSIQPRRPPSSDSSRAPRRMRSFNIRMVTIPLTVLAVGTTFFLYSRTSIQAAKVNAQRHREADGGSISWRNESMRRHGVLEKPEERTIWQQLVAGKDKDAADKNADSDASKQKRSFNPIEEGIRRARGEGSRGRGDDDGDE